ncbi:MAG: hypothetical protein AAFX03_00300 [Pseudomonadota bacterium]
MIRILILAAALAAAGCSSNGGGVGASFDTRRNAGPCPTAGAIYDMSRVIEFSGGEERFGDIAYTAEIVGVRLFCRYVGGDPILAEVEIDFAFGKGPQGQASRHEFPYFVSVTRRSGKVLSKAGFVVEAEFGREQVTSKTDLVGRILIPRSDETISGVNFEVLIGFELTEEQLAFNRAGNRFRLDAGPLAGDAAP